MIDTSYDLPEGWRFQAPAYTCPGCQPGAKVARATEDDRLELLMELMRSGLLSPWGGSLTPEAVARLAKRLHVGRSAVGALLERARHQLREVTAPRRERGPSPER